MKWINKDNIKFTRGTRSSIIAKFDNSKFWLGCGFSTTLKGAKSEIRAIGKFFNAKTVEIKYAWDENDKPAENIVLGFLHNPYDDSYKFWQITANGEIPYSSQEVFA